MVVDVFLFDRHKDRPGNWVTEKTYRDILYFEIPLGSFTAFSETNKKNKKKLSNNRENKFSDMNNTQDWNTFAGWSESYELNWKLHIHVFIVLYKEQNRAPSVLNAVEYSIQRHQPYEYVGFCSCIMYYGWKTNINVVQLLWNAMNTRMYLLLIRTSDQNFLLSNPWMHN